MNNLNSPNTEPISRLQLKKCPNCLLTQHSYPRVCLPLPYSQPVPLRFLDLKNENFTENLKKSFVASACCPMTGLPNSERQLFLKCLFFLCPAPLWSCKGWQKTYSHRGMLVVFSRALRWWVPHFITLSLLAHSQVGWFFPSKHLPSSNSGSWARLVTTMWREDLITSNTNPDCYRESYWFSFSKIKNIFFQQRIQLNSHTVLSSSFPPPKCIILNHVAIHKRGIRDTESQRWSI